jgi:AcrR family transcriptional regulator
MSREIKPDKTSGSPAPSKSKQGAEESARLPLSRERVLLAAVRLADEAGIEALSMRKLAQSLDVEAMSLYNHVANKEAMLDGMVELVVAEIALAEIGADWRAQMRLRAVSAHRVLMSHPWATMLFVARMNIGPAMLSSIDATHGCLREAGFSHALADHARNVIDSHIYGFTLQALLFPIAAGTYAEAARSFLPMLPAERYPHMRALAEQVIGGQYDGQQNFEFGLDLILDGLSTLLART